MPEPPLQDVSKCPISPEDLERLMEACASDALGAAHLETRARVQTLVDALGEQGPDLWGPTEEAINAYHDERLLLGVRTGFVLGVAAGLGRASVRPGDEERGAAVGVRLALEALACGLPPAQVRDLLVRIGSALDPSTAGDEAKGASNEGA